VSQVISLILYINNTIFSKNKHSKIKGKGKEVRFESDNNLAWRANTQNVKIWGKRENEESDGSDESVEQMRKKRKIEKRDESKDAREGTVKKKLAEKEKGKKVEVVMESSKRLKTSKK
jgi:hypothetical protein